MDGGKKNSFKVLTTNDIRKHAQDWSLAGDVGLLNYLEQFSQNICNKTQETQKYFNELVDNYEKAYTNIGNITNQFLALQNCQFVENRVYDEETPTEEKAQEKKAPDEAELEKLLLTKYKEAVEVGVKLLDTHFQEVQLPPNSDSDEEDEEVSTGNSLIWKPKNPYSAKKFPLLIGSKEWWADDSVGLGNLEENLDTEKLISESESEADSIEGVAGKRMESSSSSSTDNEKIIPTKPAFLGLPSDDLFGLSNNDDEEKDFFSKGRNSLLAEPEKFSPTFENQNETKTDNTGKPSNGNEVSEESPNIHQNENMNRTLPKINDAFTRELAGKLGVVAANKPGFNNNKDEVSVRKKTEEKSGKVEKARDKKSYNGESLFEDGVSEDTEEKLRKVEKAVDKKFYNGESLFDEPDDANDLFSGSGKIMSVGGDKNMFFDTEGDDQLFSGSNDLFAGAGSLFNSDAPKKSETRTSIKISEGKENEKPLPKTNVVPTKNSLVDDLFEDINDDDTLFASKPAEKKQGNEGLPYLENNSFNKEILHVPENSTGKDGEGLFDSINNDFGNDLLAADSFPKSEVSRGMDFRIAGESKNTTPKPQPATASDKERKQIPDELASIFESNKVSSFLSSSDKKISFLEEEDQDDLFSSTFKQDSLFKEEKKTSPPKKFVAGPDDDSSLFADKPKQQDSVSISSSRSSLFEETGASKSLLASVFEKDKNGKTDLFDDDSLFGGESSGGKAEDFFSKKPASKAKEGGKSSLFDDFDDSDDLFGGKSGAMEEKSLFEKPKEIAEEAKSAFAPEEKSTSVLGEEAPKKSAAAPDKTGFAYDLGDDDLFGTNINKTEALAAEEPRVAEIYKAADKTRLRGRKNDLGDDDLFGTDINKTALAAEEPRVAEIYKAADKTSLRGKKNDLGADDLFGTNIKKTEAAAAEEPSVAEIYNAADKTRLKEKKNNLGNDDLFGTDIKKTEAAGAEEPSVAEIYKAADKTRLRESKSDIFGSASSAHSGRKFFDDLADDATKPTPPTSLNLEKNTIPGTSTQTKSVGKLNIPDNLKVRFESMAKNISSGETKPKVKKTDEEFDDRIEPSSNLLKCPSKDRVKIPGRRRPQSRRARQEAIRNSGADFGVVSEDGNEEPKAAKTNSCVDVSQSELAKNLSEPCLPSPAVSNPLSPSTDEEDYFNVPELDTRFEKEDQGIFGNDLFQSSNDSKLDDNLLFDDAPVLSPPKKSEDKVADDGVESLFASSRGNPKPKTSIFDDEEEDCDDDDDSDGLFKGRSSSGPREPKPGPGLFEAGPSQSSRAKKPLFDTDDVDDEDDLFGGNSKGGALFSTPPVEKVSKVTEKSTESKEKENESFVDPLGLMSKK